MFVIPIFLRLLFVGISVHSAYNIYDKHSKVRLNINTKTLQLQTLQKHIYLATLAILFKFPVAPSCTKLNVQTHTFFQRFELCLTVGKF